jgi:hypothetical protein
VSLWLLTRHLTRILTIFQIRFPKPKFNIVTIRKGFRKGFDTSLVDPNQRKPRKSRKTQNTATSPMTLDPFAKGSVAIANDSVAQSSQELLGLPESHFNRHEHANEGKLNHLNGILEADVDADSETINAKTYVVEDSVTNVSKQDATNSFSVINVAKTIPLGSTKPSLRLSVPKDILHSSKKGGLALLSKSRHLSKAQRRPKLQKTTSTKDSSSVMHPKRFVHTPKAGRTQY